MNSKTKASTLLEKYKTKITSYDEIIDAQGNVKPYWESFFTALEKLGLNELHIRNDEIKRKLRENGVTYNVYNASDSNDRQWELDPIPFLLTDTEWSIIERGLQQRAEVYNLILKDLYGERKLLKEKIIPSELVFQNLGFYRACMNLKLESEKQLFMLAADIARGPDGRMWVLDNRLQAPSGSGYALENRSVMSRLLPELSKNRNIAKLSPFFYAIQQSINSLPSFMKDEPFVVYLTPGPKNETYFEHAYLASYLGYTLAQGDDLLVRDGYVWLRSIEGLHRVDVIIRRVDDDFIDPLELKDDSKLGIPGLLQVMRSGKVSIVNTPGSSILENHGLMAFMNNASLFLTGSELLLPSVATWWCGQAKELDFVTNNIEKLIIKKTNRKDNFRSVYGRNLSKIEKDLLVQMIRNNPSDFVAQEEVSLSTTPSFSNNTIEPRFAALRAFLVADGSDYYMMKGGLTRSSPIKDKFIISGQYGGISKDTWVVSDYPTDETNNKISLSIGNRKDIVLSSRSAENMFWLGRYAERTLVCTRTLINLINTLNAQTISTGTHKDLQIRTLLASITHITMTYPGFLDEKYQDNISNPFEELSDLISNPNKMGSIAYNLYSLLRTVSTVRERLTIGTWKIVDLIQNIIDELTKKNSITIYEQQRILEKLHTRLFTFYGIVNETMSKEYSLQLLELGKLLERCMLMIGQIRSCVNMKSEEQSEHEILEFLLYNYHSLISYRSKYKSEVKIAPYLEMVLFESNLPYSFVNILDRITEILKELPNTNTQNNRLSIADKAILEASAMVKLADIAELVKHDSKTFERKNFDNFCSLLYEKVAKASNAISSMYFTHTVGMQSLVDNSQNETMNEI